MVLPATAAAAPAATTTATGAVLGSVLPTLIFTPALLGLQAQQSRIRQPQISPGDLLRTALEIQRLSEAGFQPRTTTDPVTGDLVIFTEGQRQLLPTLLQQERERTEFAATPGEIAELRDLRDIIIEARGPAAAALVPSGARVTARLVGPGVVSRGQRVRASTVGSPFRLSSPCAGRQTGFSRLRCGRQLR